ncbi:MAG: YbjN domain-containing protein [Chloroflexota bacterium]
MTEIRPLNHEMIRQYLEETGGDFSVDEDGDFVVEYDRDLDSGCELTGIFRITLEYLYVVELADYRDFPRAEWDRLLVMCNAWNDAEYYPMAYLHTEDENTDQGDIRLEYCMLLKSGISQQQLTDATDEIVDRAFEFWDWAHSEYGI